MATAAACGLWQGIAVRTSMVALRNRIRLEATERLSLGYKKCAGHVTRRLKPRPHLPAALREQLCTWGLFVWMAGQAGNETGRGKVLMRGGPQGVLAQRTRGGRVLGSQLSRPITLCLRHTGCELCPGSRRWPRARLPGNMLRLMGGTWALFFRIISSNL